MATKTKKTIRRPMTQEGQDKERIMNSFDRMANALEEMSKRSKRMDERSERLEKAAMVMAESAINMLPPDQKKIYAKVIKAMKTGK